MPRPLRRLKKHLSATGARHKQAAKEIKARRRLPTVQKSAPIYWPDHIDEVRAIAMTGMTDEEMAAAMNLDPDMLEQWKQFYPSFARAIETGRTHADAQVVAALHKNAVGFEYDADEVVRTRKGAQVLTVRKVALPETNAQKFWLSNRSAAWRQNNNLQVGGQKDNPIGVDVKQETKAMVIHSILNLIKPMPDNS